MNSARLAVAVTALAVLRMLPFDLNNEEPRMLHWGLLEPNNGQLLVPARLAYGIASMFGDLAPVIAALIAAATIGAVAAFLWTRTEAIPDVRVRTVLALSLPLLPIPEPGPYVGPLNNQWWLALFVVGIALSAPKRWHLPAIAVCGFSGLAPCLMWPVFRDRRGIVLLAVAGLQAGILVASHRERFDYPADAGYLAAVLAVSGAMLVARLPMRTRLAFLYAGLAVLAFGMIGDGRMGLNYRYLAIPGTVVVLGLASYAFTMRMKPGMTLPDPPAPAEIEPVPALTVARME